MSAEGEAEKKRARGKLTARFTYKEQQELWKLLADKLNSLGPERKPEKWKKSWQDLRSDAKKVAGQLSQSAKKTGGGEGLVPEVLSPSKEKIIAISGGRTIVEGHSQVSELSVSIESESDDGDDDEKEPETSETPEFKLSVKTNSSSSVSIKKHQIPLPEDEVEENE